MHRIVRVLRGDDQDSAGTDSRRGNTARSPASPFPCNRSAPDARTRGPSPMNARTGAPTESAAPGASSARGHTPDDVITASAVVKTYGRGTAEVRALDGVSAGIPRARFTAVVGPSGSGKSTLMHCMAGLDTVTSGSIVLDGVEITGRSDRALTRLRRERIGFVFQSPRAAGTRQVAQPGDPVLQEPPPPAVRPMRRGAPLCRHALVRRADGACWDDPAAQRSVDACRVDRRRAPASSASRSASDGSNSALGRPVRATGHPAHLSRIPDSGAGRVSHEEGWTSPDS
ncbi:ATP-binding cassette domain-containing protein [Streptomyces marokkonensis]|uniref:ATP-binding cassette domain-containing protein n=1 Tax=Streptomyces marokkonensis TaxID=324855 RepID=A0ABW6QEP2_9ACTN